MDNNTYSKNGVADKFYTDELVSKRLISSLNLDEFDLIIEPSVGGYAFGKWLPKEKTICYDLYPDEGFPETIEQDYLALDLDKVIQDSNAANVLIIGNPPFGRLSGLATKFVQKSCINNKLFGYKTTVAFILSETFGKISFAERIPTTHTLTKHEHLGSPFLLDGEPYNKLNCGWFVWSPIPREKIKYKKSSEYITFHSKEEWLSLQTKDKCAIRGQGSGAGQVFWGEEAENKNPSTTRFASGPGVHVLEKINWTPYKKLTVGIPSIGQAEIILEIEKIMGNQYDTRKKN